MTHVEFFTTPQIQLLAVQQGDKIKPQEVNYRSDNGWCVYHLLNYLATSIEPFTTHHNSLREYFCGSCPYVPVQTE